MADKILDALRDWKCDVEGALERFLDDEELYLQCLNIFSTAENFVKLKEYIDSASYQDAFDSAHTLKGVAGNLGLTPLYMAIIDIVEPLRAKDYSNLGSLYDEIDKQYQIYLSCLK